MTVEEVQIRSAPITSSPTSVAAPTTLATASTTPATFPTTPTTRLRFLARTTQTTHRGSNHVDNASPLYQRGRSVTPICLNYWPGCLAYFDHLSYGNNDRHEERRYDNRDHPHDNTSEKLKGRTILSSPTRLLSKDKYTFNILFIFGIIFLTLLYFKITFWLAD